VVLTQAEIVLLTVSKNISTPALTTVHSRQTGRVQLTTGNYNITSLIFMRSLTYHVYDHYDK